MAVVATVVTPSYNQGCFIERTIQSVLSQDIEGLEYVIVDGGSIDGTLDILRKYEPRLKWISEKDGGQADAVNKGIRMTTGEIIGWLNSDDIYYPDAVRRVINYFKQHPEVDVVYGEANHIDKQDKILERYLTEAWNINRLRDICYLCQPAVFFRRRVVEQHGLLNEALHFCMDYEYWLRLASGGVKFAYMPVILAGSRMYAENKTISSRVKVHAEINSMMLNQYGCVPDKWIINYGHVVAERGNIRRNKNYVFILILGIASLYAALRWNKGVSRSLFLTIFRWFGACINRFFRRLRAS